LILIAEDLGIEHDSLLKTIKKYIDRLSRKSPVVFKIDVVKRPQGGTYGELSRRIFCSRGIDSWLKAL